MAFVGLRSHDGMTKGMAVEVVAGGRGGRRVIGGWRAEKGEHLHPDKRQSHILCL